MSLSAWLFLVFWAGWLSLTVVHSRLRRCHSEQLHRRLAGTEITVGSPPPAVDVLVACYNEEPALLEACCAGIVGLNYGGDCCVWLVDDGSCNRSVLEPVYRRYEQQPGWCVVRLDRHVGKRQAQDSAFHAGRADLVLTIDSDTVVAADALHQLTAAFADGGVGAATGKVGASNGEENLLARLIDQHYRALFERERAAQANFGTVMCCSGSLAMYRRAALEPIWRAYVEQRFYGRPAVSGDDLHLTNQILAIGYRSAYVPRSTAVTHVPTTLRGFTRQQLRWNRSFYRELSRSWSALWRRGRPVPYMALDLASRMLGPLAVPIALTLATADAVFTSPKRLPAELTAVAALLLVQARALFLANEHRPLSTAWFLLLHGLLQLGVLIPAKLRALATVADNGWGTR